MENGTDSPHILSEWLEEVSDSSPVAQIARAIGVPQRTLANHVKSGELSIYEVVSICRHYDYPVLFALERLGYITEEDIQLSLVRYTTELMPVRDLLVTAITELDTYEKAVRFAISEAKDSRTKLATAIREKALHEFLGIYRELQQEPSTVVSLDESRLAALESESGLTENCEPT